MHEDGERFFKPRALLNIIPAVHRSQLSTLARTVNGTFLASNNPPRRLMADFTVIPGQLAIDPHLLNTISPGTWLRKSGAVLHRLWVKKHHIGIIPGGNPPATVNTQFSSGKAAHLINRRVQREQPQFATVMTQYAGERTS